MPRLPAAGERNRPGRGIAGQSEEEAELKAHCSADNESKRQEQALFIRMPCQQNRHSLRLTTASNRVTAASAVASFCSGTAVTSPGRTPNSA